MLSIFRDKSRDIEDHHEIISIINRYGSDAKDILQLRSTDSNLKKRDRQHWRRLSKKISKFS